VLGLLEAAGLLIVGVFTEGVLTEGVLTVRDDFRAAPDRLGIL